MKPAVCVILPVVENSREILTISRRNNFTKWGIPGGKVEEHESSTQAAIREIYEETLLKIKEEDLQPIHSGPCLGSDGKDFWVTTYLVKKYNGVPVAEEGFQIKTMNINDLCDPQISPFSVYNHEVVSSWDLYNQFHHGN